MVGIPALLIGQGQWEHTREDDVEHKGQHKTELTTEKLQRTCDGYDSRWMKKDATFFSVFKSVAILVKGRRRRSKR